MTDHPNNDATILLNRRVMDRTTYRRGTITGVTPTGWTILVRWDDEPEKADTFNGWRFEVECLVLESEPDISGSNVVALSERRGFRPRVVAGTASGGDAA